MHDDQHHGSRRQVVEVGRQDERGQRNGPQQTLGVTGANPFGNEVEASVVVEYLDNGHRGYQEHDNACSSSHILQEYVVIDEVLDGIARRSLTVQELCILRRMLRHDEVGTPADVDHPPYRTYEHSYGSLVDTRQVTGGNQQVAYNQHYDNNQRHLFLPSLLFYLFIF